MIIIIIIGACMVHGTMFPQGMAMTKGKMDLLSHVFEGKKRFTFIITTYVVNKIMLFFFYPEFSQI